MRPSLIVIWVCYCITVSFEASSYDFSWLRQTDNCFSMRVFSAKSSSLSFSTCFTRFFSEEYLSLMSSNSVCICFITSFSQPLITACRLACDWARALLRSVICAWNLIQKWHCLDKCYCCGYMCERPKRVVFYINILKFIINHHLFIELLSFPCLFYKNWSVHMLSYS